MDFQGYLYISPTMMFLLLLPIIPTDISSHNDLYLLQVS